MPATELPPHNLIPTDLPRVLELEGASNVRDLGGYRAADGRTVRFGQVFRAAALGRLTAADAATLAATGLRHVCDLRGKVERQRAPSNLPGVTVHALSIEPSLGASLRDIADRHESTDEDVLVLMRGAYTAYALDWAHQYRRFFELLLEPDGTPLLFHCTAGKDRTGFGAALLLTALGVDEDQIHADYLATNRLWRGDAELSAALPEKIAAVLLKVHAELLHTSFNAIRTAHGTMETYLETALGLDAGNQAQLRDKLLE